MTVVELSRNADYELYLIARATGNERLHLLNALRAELLKAPRLNPEVHLAAIRLKWWEDAIADALTPAHHQNHPVLLVLSEHDITPQQLAPWIAARETEIMHREGTPDYDAFIEYLDADMAPFDIENSNIARAFAIVQLLRRLPADTQLGHIIWPRDVLAQHGLKPSDANKDGIEENLRAFTKHWCEVAEEFIATDSSPSVHNDRLITLTTRQWLHTIRKRDYQLTQLPPRLAMLPLRLMFHR